MKKDEFRNFVKSIIFEVKKEKSKNTVNSDSTNKVSGEIGNYTRDVDTKKSTSDLFKKIESIVKKIDKNIRMVHSDHDIIGVVLTGVFTIKITPKWSGIYDVEAYRNMTDRIFVPAQTEEQVLEVIKTNFSTDKKSYVQTSYEKAVDQTKDVSKKRSKELPDGETVKHKEVPDKDKEDSVTKKSDLPDAKMSEVNEKSIERQEDHGVEKNKSMSKIQKMIKKEVDDDLTKSWKK